MPAKLDQDIGGMMEPYSKVIIWGHKLHTHTHSYIHYSFDKAFRYLGYETLWLDDKDDISNINFNNCFFITEGQVCKKIPLNSTSKYVLHNCDAKQFDIIPKENKFNLQFFHSDVLTRGYNKINDWTFQGEDVIHFCWATDLLPHEIDENQAHNEVYQRKCIWIGSYDNGDKSDFQNNTELNPFFNECKKNGINVRIINPWVSPCSIEENRQIVRESMLAPAINGIFQKKTYYIPCRIFKNISYGHFGITNNFYVDKIFDGKLIYDDNTSNLFYKAMSRKSSPNALQEIKDTMRIVKEHHTYINRCQVLLNFFK